MISSFMVGVHNGDATPLQSVTLDEFLRVLYSDHYIRLWQGRPHFSYKARTISSFKSVQRLNSSDADPFNHIALLTPSSARFERPSKIQSPCLIRGLAKAIYIKTPQHIFTDLRVYNWWDAHSHKALELTGSLCRDYGKLFHFVIKAIAESLRVPPDATAPTDPP